MIARVVMPEILDGLAPDDPRAQGSRRDLRRVNALMGNAGLVAGLLRGRPLGRVLEIGAGDGALMRRVARRLGPLSSPREKGLGEPCAILLDRQPYPPLPGFAELGWCAERATGDVFDALRSPETGRFDAVVANLFLHHFEDEPLGELLRLVSGRTDLFVACEPRRSRLALATCRTLRAIGCNEVTRHDARVSVLAGFRDGELSARWPTPGWSLRERAAGPFSHVFRAERAR